MTINEIQCTYSGLANEHSIVQRMAQMIESSRKVAIAFVRLVSIISTL